MPIIPAFSGIHKKNTKNIFEISLLIWINLLYLWRQKVNLHVKVLLFWQLYESLPDKDGYARVSYCYKKWSRFSIGSTERRISCRNFQKHFSSSICPSEIFRSIFPSGFVLQKFSEPFFRADLSFRKLQKHFSVRICSSVIFSEITTFQ